MSIAQSILNIFFPTDCLSCRGAVTSNGLCSKCWSEIEFISTQACVRCGAPLCTKYDECRCPRNDRFYDGIRSVCISNYASLKLIHDFKYNDNTQLSDLFGRWMRYTGKEMLAKSDYIIPVPLTRQKMRRRLYNQSALLARKLDSSRVDYNSLRREHEVQSQASSSRFSRFENIKNAFSIQGANHLRGKKVLLVDDVITTGATISECARMLKIYAAVDKVYVLTLSKTMLGREE